ncbi:hypothetical protein HHK36_030361 [Tetracentron sinense]|uniref:ATP phosphoribosyltransferase n=1 Tax=Tetracentron sinense TaxID=13715 RepID=A0A834YCQ2_TETSI|nr:hypothetical protein HHK36_030361 [Tetracentron sinense]
MGLPSKGRMASDTLDLLKDCQLSVRQVNPRQYVAEIPLLSNLEVWFQRPKDIVRKLLSGDLDIGIVGLDIVTEYGQGNEDLVIVHDELEYGDCHLSIAIPKYGIFENINSMSDLAQMPQWTYEKPLRVATGFTYLGPKFMKEKGLKHVTFSTADGALEAAPAMGIADAILDLVSSGTTLRENNLKEIEGGVVLESQAVLVASKQSLIRRKGVLDITHEILERLEAHLRAVGQFTVTANMRGSSAEEVAERILSQTSLSGLQNSLIAFVDLFKLFFHDRRPWSYSSMVKQHKKKRVLIERRKVKEKLSDHHHELKPKLKIDWTIIDDEYESTDERNGDGNQHQNRGLYVLERKRMMKK